MRLDELEWSEARDSVRMAEIVSPRTTVWQYCYLPNQPYTIAVHGNQYARGVLWEKIDALTATAVVNFVLDPATPREELYVCYKSEYYLKVT